MLNSNSPKMVRIDLKRYIRDRMWFGIHYHLDDTDGRGILITSTRMKKSNWYYINWWTLRLWPCLREGEVLPSWWMAIFDYFGYAKDYEEGV